MASETGYILHISFFLILMITKIVESIHDVTITLDDVIHPRFWPNFL